MSTGPAYALYQRVENERASRGWTKTELARRVRMPRCTIERLKTGPRRPQPATVIRLAEVLGIPRAEALDLAGYGIDDGAVAEVHEVRPAHRDGERRKRETP